MSPRSRQVALYAIGVIAIAASANALAHSYAGLYAWAVHHRLTGWQAMSWPAEIDVFLAVGELALYVAYLDGWPGRQRLWPWVTALVGLAVSIAGNIGHIQPLQGHPVALSDRLTAATSPLAAFAGLTVGLLVLRMNRQQSATEAHATGTEGQVVRLRGLAMREGGHHPLRAASAVAPASTAVLGHGGERGAGGVAHAPAGLSAPTNPDSHLLREARTIYQTAAARGERLSQRALARQLRGHGHRFPNQQLRGIARAVTLEPALQHPTTQGT